MNLNVHKTGLTRHESGFTLIELLVAIILSTIVIAGIIKWQQYGAEQIPQSVAGSQCRAMLPGIDSYIKANYSTLEAAATATNAVAVPLSVLTTAGYLPPTFSSVNPYNQTYTLYVLQPTAGNLMALTLSSGGMAYVATNPRSVEYANIIIPGAAAQCGAAGGVVATGTTPGQTANGIYGSYGGWTVNLTGTNIPNPGPMHIAIMQYFNQGTLASDYLYRYAVPGQPQLNEMFTDLNMGTNNITNSKDISASDTVAASGLTPGTAPANGVGNGVWGFDLYAQDKVMVGKDGSNNPTVTLDGTNGSVAAQGEVSAENGNVLLSHAVTYVTQVSDGTTIPMPTYCPTGTTPSINLSFSNDSGGATAYPESAHQSWATVSGADWIVHLRVLTQAGWASPPAPYLTATAAVNCQ